MSVFNLLKYIDILFNFAKNIDYVPCGTRDAYEGRTYR